MQWQPIDTAPKDGTEIVLWCEKSKSMLLQCKWKHNEWHELKLNDFDVMSWSSLESYEMPTHWMKIVPPAEKDEMKNEVTA